MLSTKDYNTFTILDSDHKFVGAKLANKCLPGDRVEWDTEKQQCNLLSRANHPSIVGTLELTNKCKYGLTNRQIPMYLFTPYDSSYPYFIVGSSEKDITRNIICLITFGEWKDNSTFPRGNLQSILGVSGDFNAEYDALIWQACPYKYPLKAEYKPMLTDPYKRTHIKGYTFNIDPPGCRDVDDVFTFEKISDGWKVTITISDVAAYVQAGDTIDLMASKISQTLYDNTGGVLRPMLPPLYSEEACSLLPGKDSYGVSMSFIFSNKSITNIEWFTSILKVDRSYTYDEFQTSDSPYKEPLAQISSHLAKLETSASTSHEWVEQMMLFYNRESGKMLKSSGRGILRRHSQPNLEKLDRYKASGIPELEKLAYSSAEYCLATEDQTVHYGLETNAYAHASSPIRRYADLVNQRILKELIMSFKEKQIESDNVYILPLDYKGMNLRGKAVKQFSRDLDFLRAISTGDTRFSAVIVDKKCIEEKMKIKLYVPKWKRMVSTWYTSWYTCSGEESNLVLSRDESREIDVSLYREVMIECAFVLNSRNWKERVVLNII